jgi:NADP-dependent 3-hydroxy acid dehydrogenase YdfG
VSDDVAPARPFEGQVALVTGASGGVGRAVALALARHGAAVWLVARNRARLETVANQIRAEQAAAETYALDLGCDGDVEVLIETIQRDLGRLDVLVHSAGLLRRGTLANSSLADFDEMYRVNVRGPYMLTRACLPLISKARGQIVFINSSVVFRAAQQVGQYAATKHALRALADALRQEVNPGGVRVLSIFPGRTATPIQAAAYAADQRPYRPDQLLQPEDIATIMLTALALPRTAEVTDISIRPFAKTY